jgi:hypothetical protein
MMMMMMMMMFLLQIARHCCFQHTKAAAVY